MRLIDADKLCEDLLNRWNIADTRKEELIRQVMADVVTPIVVSQPTVGSQLKWILCSEKMPEEHEWVGTKKFGTTISDKVHVTFEAPNGDRFVKTLSFENGELSAFEQRAMDKLYGGSKPIAWMNFPEPYTQKEQE